MNNQISIESNIDEPLIVHLGGENTVDASLLTETINTFIKLVEKSRNEIAPDLGVQLKVKALKQGSFQIDFSTIFKFLTSESASNFVTTTGAIIACVGGVIKFASFIKGKKPKEVEKIDEEKVKVVNSEGNQIVINVDVYNVSANQLAIEDVSKLFEKLELDNSRDSISVASKEATVVEIPKEKFLEMSKPIDLDPLEDGEKLTSKVEAFLDIKKVDYLGSSKWEFYWNRLIRAKIEDEDFMSLVRDGKISFNSKDRLKVKLRIEQDLDPDRSIRYGSEKYYIEKVIEKIDLVEQSKMPGLDELK